MIDQVLTATNQSRPFNLFRSPAPRLYPEKAALLTADHATWYIPSTCKLSILRKISGTVLLTVRLGAGVDIGVKVAAILEEER